MTLMPGRRDAHPIDQVPELPARQRIDAGRRLVEDQQIRIVDQRAAQPELLPHAAGQLLCRPIGERREAGAVEQFGDAPLALVARLPEQAAEELDVLAHAEVGIEVLAEALRHVGDARSRPRARCAGVSPCRRRAREPGRLWIRRAPAMMPSKVDLPTPSGPINPTVQSLGIVERDRIERASGTVSMSDVAEPGDRASHAGS